MLACFPSSHTWFSRGLPCSLNSKESAWNAGDQVLIPGWGSSSEEGNGNPLQPSCLENPVDREAWRATSPWGRKESDTTEQLTHTHTHTHSPLDSSGLQSQICLLFILPLKLIAKYCCSDYNISLNHQLPAVTSIIFQLEYKDHYNCPNSAHHMGIWGWRTIQVNGKGFCMVGGLLGEEKVKVFGRKEWSKGLEIGIQTILRQEAETKHLNLGARYRTSKGVLCKHTNLPRASMACFYQSFRELIVQRADHSQEKHHWVLSLCSFSLLKSLLFSSAGINFLKSDCSLAIPFLDGPPMYVEWNPNRSFWHSGPSPVRVFSLIPCHCECLHDDETSWEPW